jgi:hypothetical protein
MAKLRVSELTRTGNVTGTDLVYIVQGINSRATTVANLFLASNITLAGPPGPTGPSGPPGEQGQTGPAGVPSRIYTLYSDNVSNAYLFSGYGFEDLTAVPNPPLYLYRGFQYEITNASVDDDPLVIRYSANGNVLTSFGYSQDISVIEGFGNIQSIFLVVSFAAPSTLYYQSNTNPERGNVIYII